MSQTTILYGDVVGQSQRERLKRAWSTNITSPDWFDEPRLFEPNSGGSTVYIDLDDPRFSSPDFLVSVATAGERVHVIGKSVATDLDKALHFSKLGVGEILTPDQCLERLDRLLNDLENRVSPPVERGSRFSVEAIIGTSTQTLDLRKIITVLSRVDFPSALLLGETGTGKGLVSKVLHNTGQRSAHNLVEVNCSAIPDELFESELFGHVKGAFTGADSHKMGLFEYAREGTIFLDEVGNLSSSAQAKLLKILEDKKLRKVGSVEEIDINVRVVAATNLDLTKAIEAGTFREDLYYRLNLLTLEIPALRERMNDIPPLVDHYRAYYAAIYAKPEVRLGQSATDAMQEYHWPGNVRELCNVVERAVLLCQKGTIEAQDMNLALKKNRITLADRQQLVIAVPAHGITMAEVEQQVVKQVLNLFSWNKSETAKFLGISRPRLRRIIEAAGLERNRRQS